MNPKKTLTVSRLRRYLEDPKRWRQMDVYDNRILDISPATHISPAAAAYLVKHVGGDMNLDRLTGLSAKTARILARYKGDLSLHGLTNITPATAAALAKHRSGLRLTGLSRISTAVATALSKHQGPRLALTGLRTPPLSIRNVLARYKRVLLLR